MITGDLALPQPEEREVDAPLLHLPEPVLKREALLRSFRWVFAVEGALAVYSIAKMIVRSIQHAVSLPNFLVLEAVTYLLPSLFLFLDVASFWALSSPRRFSRGVFLSNALVSFLLIMFYSVMSLWAFPEKQSGYYNYMVLSYMLHTPIILINIGIIVLMFRRPGRQLYSREGISCFSLDGAGRRPEIIWIGVVYLIFVALRMGGMDALIHYLHASGQLR